MAVGFVYLYVVPQLSSQPRPPSGSSGSSSRAARSSTGSRTAAQRGLEQRELAALVRRTAANVDSRITLLGLRGGEPAFVIADSELESEALDPEYPAASGAAASDDVRSGIETVGGSRIGETAFPVPVDARGRAAAAPIRALRAG